MLGNVAHQDVASVSEEDAVAVYMSEAHVLVAYMPEEHAPEASGSVRRRGRSLMP